MTQHAVQTNPYQAAARHTATPRGLEYQVIARITHRLREAANDAADFSLKAQSLHDNNKLWTLLAADVAGAQNGLPDTLRAQLFYLAEFVQQHSRKVLTQGATIDALIDINTSVLRGLRNERTAA